MTVEEQNACQRRLIELQGELRAFVAALCGNDRDTEDIFQNVNLRCLALLELPDAAPVQNTRAWARKVAVWQVICWRTQNKRGRILFDSQLTETLAAELAEREDFATDDRLALLKRNISRLPANIIEAIALRYEEGLRVTEIAKRMRTTPNAISLLLHRGRKELRRFIAKQEEA